MSAFGGMIQTNRGRNLQAKAQTGVKLQFTRIAVGDGYLGSSSVLDLNALINEVKSLNITKLKVQSAGKVVVGTVLSNQSITSGFYFREIGVFAQDPDVGEILYCYANAGANAEYIPAGGGADVIEKSIDTIAVFGSTSNVEAVIDQSLVYISETTDITINAAEIPVSTGNGTVRQVFNWLANRIKAITGKANWWDDPTKSLEEINVSLVSHQAETATTIAKGHVQLGTTAGTAAVGNHGHTDYIPKSLATAANDFLVGVSGGGDWIKKTLAEIKTILGLGTAAYTASTAYATSAQGTKADNALPASSYTAADIKAKLLTVDGSGSTIDADMVDGKHADSTANNLVVLDASAKVPIANVPTGTTSSTVSVGNHTHSTYLPLSGGMMSGELNCADQLLTRPYIKDYAEVVVDKGTATGTVIIDLQAGNVFKHTLSGTTTYSFGNSPVSGRAGSFTLRITVEETAYTITFPASVKWADDIIPNTSTILKVYDFVFSTINGGTTWHGAFVGLYSA